MNVAISIAISSAVAEVLSGDKPTWDKVANAAIEALFTKLGQLPATDRIHEAWLILEMMRDLGGVDIDHHGRLIVRD